MPKTVSKYNTTALISLYVFFFECTVGGAGRMINIGPVSLRMILFAIALVMTFPEVIRKFGSLCRIGYFHALGLFFATLAVTAVYGLIRGNSRAFIAADLSPFLTLLLLPGAVAILDTRERREFAAGIVMWGSLAVALATCTIHAISPFVPDTFMENLSRFIADTESGGLAAYSYGASLYRIFLKSQMFMTLGALLFLRKSLDSDKKTSAALYIAASAVEIYATILSFTRGFWLGLAAAFMLFLIFRIREKTRKLVSVIALLSAFVILFFGISALLYRSNVTFDAVINRIGLTVGVAPSEEHADFSDMEHSSGIGDEIRDKTLDSLYGHLKTKFFTGYGLGANLDGIRTEGKTEYTYLDMLMKLGVPGFIVFIWVTTWHAVRTGEDSLRRLFRRKKSGEQAPAPTGDLAPALACGYVGMLISSIWNPFLLSPMGMLMLILLAVATIGEKVGKKSNTPKEE